MAAYEDGREYDSGDTLVAGGVTYEVTGVQYKEDETGKKSAFTYHIRNKDELDAEIAEQRQRDIDAASAQEEAVNAAAEQQNQADAASEKAVDVNDKEAVAKAHEEFDGELSVNDEKPDEPETPEEEAPGKGGEEKLPSLNAN